jgi:hypothetical protein
LFERFTASGQQRLEHVAIEAAMAPHSDQFMRVKACVMGTKITGHHEHQFGRHNLC